MKHAMLPVAELEPDPDNARGHDARSIRSLKRTLQQFGQRRPIVVQVRQDGTRQVRAGSGVLMALKAMGAAEVWCILVEETDREALAYALVDNRSGELSQWDRAQLRETAAGIRADLIAQDVATEALGWEPWEFELLADPPAWVDTIKGANADEGMPEGLGLPVKLKMTPRQTQALMLALQHAKAAGLGDDDATALTAMAGWYAARTDDEER